MPYQLKKACAVISVTALYAVTFASLGRRINAVFLSEPQHASSITIEADELQQVEELPLQKLIIRGNPARLYIPSINFDREVLRGEYDAHTATWQITPKGIHFATLSSMPNDFMGQTLLYAHNNRHAFGPLKQLSIGAQAVIVTDNDHTFTYELISITDHQPTDTTLFQYRGTPLLTLQTCSGAFNEIRTFYTFTLKKVNA